LLRPCALIALNHPSVEFSGVARDGHRDLAIAARTVTLRTATAINMQKSDVLAP
jgi:hypothetical protein